MTHFRARRRLNLPAAVGCAWSRRRQDVRLASDDLHNERILYIESIFQALMDAGVFSFWGVFLVRLGAPTWLVAVFTSAPALLLMAAVLPAGAFVQSRTDLVGLTIRARVVFRLVTAGFALLPLLPLGLAPYVLVAARSLLAVPAAVLNVSVTTIWGVAIRPERRMRWLSTRWAINGLFAAGMGYVFGLWLDAAPFPFNYQILFLTSLISVAGSSLVMRRLRIAPNESTVPKRIQVSMRDAWERVKGEPAFKSYLVAALVFRVGLNLPAALVSVYWVRSLGCGDAWIGTLMMVERLLSVGTYSVLGRVSARPRIRRWLWLACVGVALYPLTTALATTPQMLLIPALVGGTFGAAMNVFITDKLLEVVPAGERPSFVAVDTFAANLMAFAAPLLGTALAAATSLKLAFLVAAGLRAVGGLAFGGQRRRTPGGPRA
jgi:hypothetical protein